MLKISEMANLAGTTRRTLIYYDEQGIFKPIKKTKNGYRYYDYSQLYDLMLILGLRNLNISLEEIKAIKEDSSNSITKTLVEAKEKVNNEIHKLKQIRKVINQKIDQNTFSKNQTLYEPAIFQCDEVNFWCSNKAASCTEEEIAELFSSFYKNLNSLTIMNSGLSGFLTDLSLNNPAGYVDAGFRIIKEADFITDTIIPIINKAAGNYACILVENNEEGIVKGLKLLKAFCKTHNLKTNNNLWQINFGDSIIEKGTTKSSWLEYKIL